MPDTCVTETTFLRNRVLNLPLTSPLTVDATTSSSSMPAAIISCALWVSFLESLRLAAMLNGVDYRQQRLFPQCRSCSFPEYERLFGVPQELQRGQEP